MPSPFTYTPLHGTGGLCLPHILHEIGIGERMVTVASQMDPDPNFPTVPFPNPEEDGALDLAMMAAENNGRKLLIANDPDADRFAMAHIIPEYESQFLFAFRYWGHLLTFCKIKPDADRGIPSRATSSASSSPRTSSSRSNPPCPRTKRATSCSTPRSRRRCWRRWRAHTASSSARP
jgi:hypothetical protein